MGTRTRFTDELKQEAAVLESYRNFQSALGTKIEFLERPDPPDAIVAVNGI